MERADKVIIEFNGLPGTGKTTVCKALGDKLQDTFSVYYRVSPPKSKITRYLSYLTDGSAKLTRIAKRFAGTLGSEGAEARNAHIASLVKYYRMYRRFLRTDKKDNLLLIDQGVIQSLISIAYDKPIKPCRELDDIFVYLKGQGIEFETVDCVADTELSVERIESRGGAGGRLDDISDKDALNAILETQKNNFEVVRAAASVIGCNGIQIDTRISADQNAEKISEALL